MDGGTSGARRPRTRASAKMRPRRSQPPAPGRRISPAPSLEVAPSPSPLSLNPGARCNSPEMAHMRAKATGAAGRVASSVPALLLASLLLALQAPSQARPRPLSRRAPPSRVQALLRLRGAGWLASSSESVEAGGGAAAAAEPLSAGDSSTDSGPVDSRYTLSATGLLDPAQYNVTDDVLDLFLRPPPRPTTRDGKPLCGVGLLLSKTEPHRVDYIRPGSPADLSSKIFVGDEVVSMDGRSLRGLPWEQIRDLGLGFENTVLTLQLIPREISEQSAAHGMGSASFTIELTRVPEYAPWFALPVAGDPGVCVCVRAAY